MTAQTDLYDQMLADVYALTNRPDLEEETAIALRSATISVHSRAAFPRDSAVSLVKIPNAAFIFAVDIQLLLPRLRGLSTVRMLDINYDPLEYPQIEVREMGDIYDPEYKTLLNNIAYIAGTSLTIRTAAASYGALIEYFKLPEVRRETYNSWIAQLQPDPIVYSAAAKVMLTNGNEEKGKSYLNLVQNSLVPELISNFLTSQMR